MKLFAFLTSFAFGASVSESNSGARQAITEINSGVRSDGNSLLISQMLEFYLTTVHGINANKVDQMLSYGCYCQLLTNRKIGVGEPVDEFDAICHKYQKCTKCVQVDEAGKLIDNGGDEKVECNWEEGRYEISFLVGQVRVDCTQNKGCGGKLCSCDEELSWELAENMDLFNRKMASQNGFEFSESCVAQPPKGNGGGNRGELQCCGKFPARFPYHDKNGGRQCCVDKVYNVDDKQCCNNGNFVGIDESC